ncbi:hypothetical protein evm_007870 [Chilo suppressalis]|nr:hypothetical protein evm_007870 [Chilo suppressalis]
MTDTRRRVKLYALNADRQWDDRGTGHVSSYYVERLKGTSLLVRAESDGSLLLESKIQPDTAYQKQQDTLIVWSEGDNFDLALSFQEKAGCDEIWEKICQVQGKDPSVEITQDIVEESEDERFDEMSDSVQPVELPACEMGRLEDISELVNSCLVSPARKDKLAAALESQHYIKKLLNLFHMCEDIENIEGLHHLYEIFKSIFLLNKNALFDTMFADDTIFDVVGCLEYDPSLPQPKKHREYLRELAKFREAIPIKNQDLLAKIHQTYRVQYIQDIVLPTPTVFEDNLLSTLSSFIFFNKVEIVKLIEEDEKFLTDLFKLLMDNKTPNPKRRDLVLFLKEFCNFSQNLQPQDKDVFYKTLVSLGILPALEITLSIDDQKTKTASIDILTYIVEFSPSVVRDYTLQQANNTEEEHMLLNIVIEQMLRDRDPELGGAVQLMGVLRILLDPESMLASVNKSEKADFLNFFYKHSIQTLIAPLLENTTGEKPLKEDYHTVQLLGLVLELLSFCVEHHTYHIKTCILNKVKAIFEKAISKNMLTYNDAENLWLTYLEYVRRQTNFESDEQVQKLRQTFRLAWDTLAEAWGEQANDCEIPIYWARLEYRRMNDPKQGKEIFEEIFKYGENKTMCKYWEIFIRMEFERSPPLPENKRRDLYRRALRFIVDYPPAVTRPWSDYERDYGSLETAKECYEACEIKLKEWKESYQAMKEKMFGKKQKGKQADKKGKFDKKKQKREEKPPKNKNKRKSGESVKATETKRKKDNEMEVEESEQKESEPDQSGSGVKRTHEGDDSGEVDSKRIKTDATSSERSLGTRDACTLFVSNLEFKIDEQKLRDILSKFGDIVSLRVKSGNKAFGGSICYCQYKTPVCVEEALKHDRTPLEGRPMFFSHYSAKKVKTGFKYSTETEKNKLFIKNLPYSHCTKESLAEIFDKYGKLKDVRVVTFKDGKPKGLAYVEYEDEASASQAIAGTNGMLLGDRHIEVAVSQPPPKAGSSGTVTLGQPKRDQGQGMRRTQLSSFIPSVLQKPVASTSTANGHSGDEKRPLSNTDFRNLLLKK